MGKTFSFRLHSKKKKSHKVLKVCFNLNRGTTACSRHWVFLLNSIMHRSETKKWLTDKERAPPEQLVEDSTQLLNFGLVAPTRLPRHLPASRLPVPPPSRSIGVPPTQGRAVAMVSHPKTPRLRHQCIMTKLVRTVLVRASGARRVSRHYINDDRCCLSAISANRISICGRNDLARTHPHMLSSLVWNGSLWDPL